MIYTIMRWDIMKWILLGLFIIILSLFIKKRGYVVKDKTGKEVKTKEFFNRWKSGVEGITPLQISKSQVTGTLYPLCLMSSLLSLNADTGKVCLCTLYPSNLKT